ncbi:MAG: SAM-dependent methyltransferase [Denitrovibrio sp.]|nr:MAG: SAM-dependent methyltransferase [Denitrovibrio sp.]
MLKNKAFRTNTEKYDAWFDKYCIAYDSELKAMKALGISGKTVEIGIGTGKFAKPLGINLGIEPTKEMYIKAIELGIDVIEGTAESLPLRSYVFDWVVMVTTICFVTDPAQSLKEISRILKKGGRCAIGLVDKDTELGRMYIAKKDKSEFYQEATFYSATEIINLLKNEGFQEIISWQTLTDTTLTTHEEPIEGYGQGGFVVISGKKP